MCTNDLSASRYTLREMWASLSRNLTLTVAAVITSMVSLFLFGHHAADPAGVRQPAQPVDRRRGDDRVRQQRRTRPTAVATIEEALESRPELIKNVEYCDVDCSLAQAQKLFAADPSR